MPKLLTSATAALILLAGVATAQAQLAPSVATLPPQGTVTAAEPMAVAPSPKYVGPAAGGPESANFAASQKPAGYDGDTTMRPYTSSGMGPKPN